MSQVLLKTEDDFLEEPGDPQNVKPQDTDFIIASKLICKETEIPPSPVPPIWATPPRQLKRQNAFIIHDDVSKLHESAQIPTTAPNSSGHEMDNTMDNHHDHSPSPVLPSGGHGRTNKRSAETFQHRPPRHRREGEQDYGHDITWGEHADDDESIGEYDRTDSFIASDDDPLSGDDRRAHYRITNKMLRGRKAVYRKPLARPR